ncbi:hypothetical protein HPP92_019733 [Vanilla planifolia]|uniref:DCD domain-containing protein n=1 Tax=Vanilla planifolia TaxID=51239 RepID=A0A835Q5X2_VANPL|nr:hypothetical protein HPP92_019733 [Vanilla planifolia]
MGAGRKTQTINVDRRNPASESVSRNLHKNYLGGVIFGCKNSTITECLSKQLFGLPAAHFSYVRNIGPGLPLFLFNYSDRKLHGIYESASHGQMNIDAYAWTDGGAERTDFPAQVRVRINVQCRPLDEKEFKKVIEDNYYTARHFWFELDHAQARRLMSLFKPIRPTHVPALISNSQTNNFPPIAASKWKEKKDKKVASSVYENKFAVLDWDSGTTDCGGSSDTSCRAIEDIDNKEPLSDWAKLAEGDLDGPDPGVCSNFGVHESLDRQPVEQEDYKIVLLKLKSFWENSKLNSSSCCIGDANNLCTQEDRHYHNEKSLDDSYTTLEKDEDVVPSKLYHGNIMPNSEPRAVPITEEHQMTQDYSDRNTNRKVGSVSNESCNFNKEETNPIFGYLCQEKGASSTHLCDGKAEVTKHMLEVIGELKMQIAKLEQQQVQYII